MAVCAGRVVIDDENPDGLDAARGIFRLALVALALIVWYLQP